MLGFSLIINPPVRGWTVCYTAEVAGYLSVAAHLRRLRLGPCRQYTAVSLQLAAPCQYELHTRSAAPNTLCDLTKKQHCIRIWALTDHVSISVHICTYTPFLAASWMGDASRYVVWMEALCCKISLTQAALPLLQELKRGVAPSVDTASTCGAMCK